MPKQKISDRDPTAADLDKYISKLELQNQQLTESLSAYSSRATPSVTNKPPSFYTGNYLWNTPTGAHLRGRYRQPDLATAPQPSTSDKEEEYMLRHQAAKDEGVPPPHLVQDPQPTTQPANPGEGTLQLLLQQMQLDRQALVTAITSQNTQKQTMQAIPQCQPMSPKEDIHEYIQCFEETQNARGNPQQNWVHTLLPLLNRNCKAVAMTLPAVSKFNYKLLKAELLASASHSTKHASKAFWEYQKLSGSTWRETVNTLTKKITLFTPGPTIQDVRSQIVTEKLLQLLPFRAQAFVREREPKTALEAADLASSYFHSHNMDEIHWDTTINKKQPSSPKANFKQNLQSQHQSRHIQSNHHPNQSGHRTFWSHDKNQVPHYVPNYQPGTNPVTKDTNLQPNQQAQQPRNFQTQYKGDLSKVTCFKCGERGHKADACIKINLVSTPCLFGSFTAPPILKPGRIGNKDVQLFMDSRADSSIIARELLPDNYTQCMSINVTGVNSQDQPTLCQTALFPATIDGHDVQMFAAVVDGKDLPHPIIIGRSIPGLNIQHPLTRATRASSFCTAT